MLAKQAVRSSPEFQFKMMIESFTLTDDILTDYPNPAKNVDHPLTNREDLLVLEEPIHEEPVPAQIIGKPEGPVQSGRLELGFVFFELADDLYFL